MFRIATIVGARPQFIKSAAVSRAVRNYFSDQITEMIIHTGQHYDEQMSQVFFDQLELREPDVRLETVKGNHGVQTGHMLAGIEQVLTDHNPDVVLVYGDTNTTLAGALAAAKLNIPVVHVEAGLRSFNKAMPEEINRVLCDHVSAVLFTPTVEGLQNLKQEGIYSTAATGNDQKQTAAVFHSGDVMYDNALFYVDKAEKSVDTLSRYHLVPEQYFLATIHRNYNTDDITRLQALFEGLLQAAEHFQQLVVIPLHPRTAARIANDSALAALLKQTAWIKILPPVSFFDMLVLEKSARLIFTDSGGVQKEAFFFERPCVILRTETEWVELVSCGAALLADADPDQIAEAAKKLLQHKLRFPSFYGNGHAAEFICERLIELKSKGVI